VWLRSSQRGQTMRIMLACRQYPPLDEWPHEWLDEWDAPMSCAG
jgi:hypothetical protein